MSSLPPYARRWRPGTERMPLYVFVGGWDRAARESGLGWPVLLLPPGEPPEGYTWPVRGRDIVINCMIPTDDATLSQLCDCLLQAGAESIACLGECTHHLYIPEQVAA